MTTLAVLSLVSCRTDDPLSGLIPTAKRQIADIPATTMSGGAGHYASNRSTTGGTGTYNDPWDLETALNQALPAGDTLWLLGGTYYPAHGIASSLTGMSGNPIYVRQYPGDPVKGFGPAIIDGVNTLQGDDHSILSIDGQWVVYWGFEITDSWNMGRQQSRPHLIYNRSSGHHNRYVGLVMHDGGVAFYKEASASDVAVIGTVSYNNGDDFINANGNVLRGHGIYIRNANGNLPMRVSESVFFDNFGYGIHASSDKDLAGEDMYAVVLRGNTSFNNGSVSMDQVNPGWNPNILLGVGFAGRIADQDTVRGNLSYYSPGVGTHASGITVGWPCFTIENVGIVVDSNYVVGGSYIDQNPTNPCLPHPDYRGALHLWRWSSAVVKGNRIWSANSVTSVLNASGINWNTNSYFVPSSASAWINQNQPPVPFLTWQGQTGLGGTDQFLTGADTVIRRAASLDWLNGAPLKRGTIAVVNWSHATSKNIDLAGFVAVGDSFWIRNVQQLGTIAAQGIYQTGMTVPLTLAGATPPDPVGTPGSFTRPPTTHEAGALVWFDAFVVDSRTPAAQPPPPPATPGIAAGCYGPFTHEKIRNVWVRVTQNAPGTTLTLQRFQATITTWPNAPSGVYEYSPAKFGAPDGDYRANASNGTTTSPWTATIHIVCPDGF